MKFSIRLVVILLVITSSSFTKYSGNVASVVSQNVEDNTVPALVVEKNIPELDDYIDQYVENTRFNGNILVSHDGELICNRSYGYADFVTKDTLTSESIFQLASVSKQFTAMAIMILKEMGKLDYDDCVKEYIPTIPYSRITIRHLLNHTAGLPNYMWLVEKYWKQEQPPYNDDIIILLARYHYRPFFSPGTRYSYCNTGYVILASIVERVSNKFFADFVKENIFDPLNMDNSFVYSRALERDYPGRLDGYSRHRRRYVRREETLHDGVVGDKGVFSTVQDLFKWDQALYSEKLVTKATLEEAYTPLTLKNKRHWHYGFGFRIREDNYKKAVYHYGTWNSFKTCILRFLNDRNTIIILNNTNQGIGNLVTGIENILASTSYTQNDFEFATY